MTASGVGIRHAGYLKVIILLNIYFLKKLLLIMITSGLGI